MFWFVTSVTQKLSMWQYYLSYKKCNLGKTYNSRKTIKIHRTQLKVQAIKKINFLEDYMYINDGLRVSYQCNPCEEGEWDKLVLEPGAGGGEFPIGSDNRPQFISRTRSCPRIRNNFNHYHRQQTQKGTQTSSGMAAVYIQCQIPKKMQAC